MKFEQLKEKLAKVQIGRSRLTDLKKGVYSIELDADAANETVYLVSDKKVRTPISVTAFAGLRIVTSADHATVSITTADARDNENYRSLQHSVVNEGMTIDSSTKFTVVHNLRIKEAASDDLVYKNENYNGYAAYLKSSREAAALPGAKVTDTDEQKTARNAAFTKAGEELRASKVKPNTPITDKTLVLMPVFTVTN